jgi:hypothetical protein
MIQQAKSSRLVLDEQTFNKHAFAECHYRATEKAPLTSGAFSIWRVVGQFDCGGGFPLVSECRRRIFGKIARGNDDGLKTASAFRDSMETATPERSVSL